MGRGFLTVDSPLLGSPNNVAVATTSTAAVSSAFGTETHQVRICASAVCYFKVGDPAVTPTAAVTDAMLPANWIDFVTVRPGQKISFYSPTIQTISVVEVAQ